MRTTFILIQDNEGRKIVDIHSIDENSEKRKRVFYKRIMNA